MDRIGLLSLPVHTKDAQALFDEDQEELGYVMNVSRLWAYQPGTVTALFELMGQTLRERRLQPTPTWHPRLRGRLLPGRLVLLLGLGVEARQVGEFRSGRGRHLRGRQRAGGRREGDGGLGPKGGPGPQHDNQRRPRGPPKRRLRRSADLRHDRFRGLAVGFLDGKRHARRRARCTAPARHADGGGVSCRLRAPG